MPNDCPAIVSVIVRASVEALAATTTSTLPEPVPDVADNDTPVAAPTEAVQLEGLQPDGVAVIATGCVPPAGGAANADGAI